MSLVTTTLNSTFTPQFSPPNHVFQIREFRVYRRRRLKQKQLKLRSELGNPNFHDFLSLFPSTNSLEFIAPAIGFVSGATLFLSNLSNSSNRSISAADSDSDSVIGEWLLLTSPTPFNRAVLLRCPAISPELFQDENEKLVLEDGHFVKVNSGKIRLINDGGGFGEEKIEYQRVCVSTEDGGIVSLDWPANLDLQEEHGLDTTFILVPGTALGSMDPNVMSFVREALDRGCFPIVMNPRGCAGSPLTTPSL